MGASASRQTLLPAEEVQEGPYELKSLRYTYLISNPSQSVEVLTDETLRTGLEQLLKAGFPGRRTPVLRGTLLKVAVWLVESPIGGIITAKSMRDSGIPQVRPKR